MFKQLTHMPCPFAAFLAFLILPSMITPVVSKPTALSSRTIIHRDTRFKKLRRQDTTDYADTAHCPGGSIGDADSCTFEATTIYDQTLYRWTLYGPWFDNCNPTDTAAITTTVTDEIDNTNSFTESTEISVGIESEGFSAGISQSFEESWFTTVSYSEAQSITVNPQQAGNINVGTQYIVADGHIKINYGSRQNGHYIWLAEGLQVFTPDPSSPATYSANVANCSDISEPAKGVYYWLTDDLTAVTSGTSTSYTYPDNS